MRRPGEAAGLGLLVVLAVALRAHHLGSPTLWVDEAESAINALTIVAEGVPGDRFLGQPLYENTLVRPWPDSSEYEFRDISYSDRGLVVYHGWLPLYAIAGAFRLAGVTPEEARRGSPVRDASRGEMLHWTAVPRWPSLVFSALFVVAAWSLGRAMHSAPAGWALAFAAATSNVLVWFGRQARYYSATLAGTAVCGLAIWNACRRGRLRDHVLAGTAIGVLFHVHSLSAVTMACTYAASLPLARHQARLWLRALAAGTTCGLLVLPWAVWSGWIGHTTHLPAARDYVDVPMLLWSLPSTDPVVLGTAGVGLAWLTATLLLGDRLGDRWRLPVAEHARAFFFTVAWLALSYGLFVAFMPAASFFVTRLKLAVAVPGLVLDTLVIASFSRAVLPSSRVLPVAGIAAMLFFAGQLPPRLAPERPAHGFGELFRLVRSWRLGPEGRIFASPNDHLVLTYYSGRPVQSIAPVRREWLERFEGDLVVVEGPWFDLLSPEDVAEVAGSMGRALTPAAARSRADGALRLTTVLALAASGADVGPVPRALDDFDRGVVGTLRRRTRAEMVRMLKGSPLRRAASPSNWQEFREAFFYWFSDPERRRGSGLNYRKCRDTADVLAHDSGFVVYDCRVRRNPPLVPAVTAGAGDR